MFKRVVEEKLNLYKKNISYLHATTSAADAQIHYVHLCYETLRRSRPSSRQRHGGCREATRESADSRSVQRDGGCPLRGVT